MKKTPKKNKVKISDAHMYALEQLKIATQRVNALRVYVMAQFELACKEADIKPDEVYTLDI